MTLVVHRWVGDYPQHDHHDGDHDHHTATNSWVVGVVHLGVVEVKRGRGHTGGHRSTGAVHNCTPPQCANNIPRRCEAQAIIHSSTFASKTVCLCVIEFLCMWLQLCLCVMFVCVYLCKCVCVCYALCTLRTTQCVGQSWAFKAGKHQVGTCQPVRWY